jgi:hypothetical protein
MRSSLIVILILLGNFCHAQWRQDTTISKKTLDSLQNELVRYKDASHYSYFNKIILNHTATVDSVYSVYKDTLIVTNYSKANTPLRKQETHFDKEGCKRWQIDTYNDTTGRKLYEERWNMGCNWENNISGFLQYRYRYHYDSTGKETRMTMESYDGGGHRVQRFYYTIDITGNKVVGKRVKLSKYAFWD